MLKFLFAALLLGNPSVHYRESEPEYVGTVKYFPFVGATASTVLGPAAPAFQTCGSLYGQQYTAPAVQSYHVGPLLPCWNGVGDIYMGVFFVNEEGDAIQNGETIIFDFEYRSVGVTGGTGLAGAITTIAATHTQVGAGGDCELMYVEVTIDQNDADQPYTYGDSIVGPFSVNAASTYSGDPIVTNVFFFIPFKTICHIS